MAPKTRRQKKFDFAEWISTAGLANKTKKLLKDNGLCDMESLLLLTQADLDALQLPMAQVLRTRKALVDLGNTKFQEQDPGAKGDQDEGTPDRPRRAREDRQQAPSPREASPSPECSEVRGPTSGLRKTQALPGSLLAAGATLDELMGNLDNKLDLQEEQVSPVNAGYDPRVHLTLKASSRKAAKVYSFLPDKVKERIQRNRRDRFCFSQWGSSTPFQRAGILFNHTSRVECCC